MSSLHALFGPIFMAASSLRVPAATFVFVMGAKSAIWCLGPTRPLNTRGPSGKMTISPSRSVASANSCGSGFSPSPIGFGVMIFGGASNLTSGRFVSIGGRRANSGLGRGARRMLGERRFRLAGPSAGHGGHSNGVAGAQTRCQTAPADPAKTPGWQAPARPEWSTGLYVVASAGARLGMVTTRSLPGFRPHNAR